MSTRLARPRTMLRTRRCLSTFRTKTVALHGALAMAGTRKSNLYRRVEMLLNQKFHVSGFSRKRVVIGFAALMAASGVLLASLQLTGAAVRADDVSGLADKPSRNPEDNTPPKGDQASNKMAAESAEHSGYVYDIKTNEPIAGATVIVTRMNSGDWRELAVTESKTDANGKYTFTIPPDQLSQRLLYIMFDLRHPSYAQVHCGSYSYSMIRKNLKLGAAPWFTRLHMIPGAEISGRLVDQRGNPVAGAQLRAESKDPSLGRRARGSHVKSATDEEGRFSIVVTEEGPASLSIIPSSHCMKHLELAERRGDLGDIVLAEGAPMSGRVVDAAGKPVGGVWVNVRQTDTEREASYEMLRSSKTNQQGQFLTRPIAPGEYSVNVEMKATGALEKRKYANFHDAPPPAMFVQQIIEVAEGSTDKPVVIQAVPHIFISGQCYDSKGKPRDFHWPSIIGQLNGQFVWVQEGRSQGKGAFELMIPHGIEDARLRFSTNEHSALTIQFGDAPPSVKRSYQYKTIEQDIGDIKIVRYVAPILQVKVLDQQGNAVTDARVMSLYKAELDAAKKSNGTLTTAYFEKQGKGIYRSSSLTPGYAFEVFAQADGLESEHVTMNDGGGRDRDDHTDARPKTTGRGSQPVAS